MDRADLIALYDRLIAPHDGIERKGKTMPYTAVNGNMFSFVDPDDRLCLRLSDEDRQAWAAEWPAEPVMQYGSVMQGYVAVPSALAEDQEDLEVWFSKAVQSARALKPKPTKRKK
ncbi:MAG: TfoX/Sxy family protein [Pseudomonadota bacterium]